MAFIVFTQAIVELPWAPIWSILFFTMLLALGMGSMFGNLAGIQTSIFDLKLFPWLKKQVLSGTSTQQSIISMSNPTEHFILFSFYSMVFSCSDNLSKFVHHRTSLRHQIRTVLDRNVRHLRRYIFFDGHCPAGNDSSLLDLRICKV